MAKLGKKDLTRTCRAKLVKAYQLLGRKDRKGLFTFVLAGLKHDRVNSP